MASEILLLIRAWSLIPYIVLKYTPLLPTKNASHICVNIYICIYIYIYIEYLIIAWFCGKIFGKSFNNCCKSTNGSQNSHHRCCPFHDSCRRSLNKRDFHFYGSASSLQIESMDSIHVSKMRLYTHAWIYIKKYIYGNTRGITVISLGKRVHEQSSNLQWRCLHFTSC